MKIVFLDQSTLGNDVSLTQFQKFGEVVLYPLTAKEEIPARIEDADVVVINKCKLLKESLVYAKKLKLICVAATGYDVVDIPYCKQQSIGVCNVAGYSTDSVTECTIALALALMTHLKTYTTFTSTGYYTKNGVPNILTPTYHELRGKTWGILGYGAIGKSVATVARAFGCHVLYTKNHPDAEDKACVSLETLCKESDILSIHVPLNDKTKNLISEKEIGLMKPNVILINEARGAVTDEKAIAKAIIEHRIGGFGCDVFSLEPYPDDHPFKQIEDHDGVLLTPHMAWGAYEARVRLLEEIALNIESFLQGKTRSRVDL